MCNGRSSPHKLRRWSTLFSNRFSSNRTGRVPKTWHEILESGARLQDEITRLMQCIPLRVVQRDFDDQRPTYCKGYNMHYCCASSVRSMILRTRSEEKCSRVLTRIVEATTRVYTDTLQCVVQPLRHIAYRHCTFPGPYFIMLPFGVKSANQESRGSQGKRPRCI